MNRYTEIVKCPYSIKGCTFSGTEVAVDTHLKLHGSAKRPEPGSRDELVWMMYNVTEEDILFNQPHACPTCNERCSGLLEIRKHVRSKHPEVIGGVEE